MVNAATATGYGEEDDKPWRLVIHGGAGRMTRDRLSAEQEDDVQTGLAAALSAGSAVLAVGGSALDAVTRSVIAMEDDPLFNAGRGSAISYEGTVELDAAIMDGKKLKAGAVAFVQNVKNQNEVYRIVRVNQPDLRVLPIHPLRLGATNGSLYGF